jgi:tripartite ATP-independent transporter DctM subunit
MDRALIGWIAIGAVFVLLALRVPVAIAMLASAMVGYGAISGFDKAFTITGIVLYGSLVQYTLTVVPLFLLMGHFAQIAGFAGDVFQAAKKWVGHWPGGVVQATVAGAAAFGAASGSGIAACAIVGKVTIPEMLRMGVDRRLAFGTVASAGTIAAMIPPSILMVIYGVITNQSIAKLLIAGIIPGLVITLVYMVTIYVLVRRDPSLVPVTEAAPWKEKIRSVKSVWGVALLAFVVMGGIYAGWFTPTEAGGVGAFAAMALAIATRRLGWPDLRVGLVDAATTTGMVYFIVGSAFVFGSFLAITGIPNDLSQWVISLEANRYVILLAIILLYVVMGCFLDMLAGMVLTLPIIFPAIVKLGFDPIWFGVLMVNLCELALITPPYGLNLFVLRGVVPDANMRDIIVGAVPFVLAGFVIIALLVSFPEAVLWLPSKLE